MSRITHIVSVFSALLLSPSAALHAADKPNILFLFSDDVRVDTIAAHGNPHINTPNIDKLAASGFSFRGNCVFGGNSGAVCVPNHAGPSCSSAHTPLKTTNDRRRCRLKNWA